MSNVTFNLFYIYFRNSSCPVLIHSHFYKAYLTVSLKQCPSGLFSQDALLKQISKVDYISVFHRGHSLKQLYLD